MAEPVGDMKDVPEHNLGPSLNTLIKKDVNGLGLVLIEHGSFLQIVSIIGNNSGGSSRAANLKPGDILVKIGSKNVLGHNLRELRRLVGEIPMGTQLQLTVYRNYKDLPDTWKTQPMTTHSNESIQFSNEEEDWSSSSDEEDNDEHTKVKFKNFKPLSLFWHDKGIYIPPISRAWHAPKKNRNVLLVGPHVGCDIVLHQAFDDYVISNDDEEVIPNLHPLWSAESDTTSSTSSSSSSTDLDWIQTSSSIGGKNPLDNLPQQGPIPHPKQLGGEEQGEKIDTTESTTITTTLESTVSPRSESPSQNSKSGSLNTFTQSNDTDSETSTSTEDQMTGSSSSDTIIDNAHQQREYSISRWLNSTFSKDRIYSTKIGLK
ncbi:PDZ domain-containing protein 9 isoform X2 [Rhincodon typus]|uniref:PDZ domain-containing protein 9 isoform X2 n=1 Tax=Rhincodon typus TaxID=259920 RepID=UPI00202EE48D|nr:PDZ domain-containing protein 9 isoform X2 [Rhincodon typus]